MPPPEPDLLPESLNPGRGQSRQGAIDFLRCQACEILRLPPERLPLPERSLNELGFDSMAAMELRHRIEAAFGALLPPQDFSGSRTLTGLADLVCQRLVLANVVQAGAAGPAGRDGSEEFDL
jgi:acyl carrier protein